MKHPELIALGLIAVFLGALLLFVAGPYIPDAWKPGAGPHMGGEVAN